MRRCAISPSRAITPRALRIFPRSSTSRRARSFNISEAKPDFFSKRTKKRCARFPRTSIAHRKFAKRDFSRFCTTGCSRTERLLREDWIPYRVALLGNYGVDLALKREINRFLLAEDPYGSTAFVRLGIARGEVRSDIDPALIVSILDWTMERFQDALLTEELDPGTFSASGRPREKSRADSSILVGAQRRDRRLARRACGSGRARNCINSQETAPWSNR